MTINTAKEMYHDYWEHLDHQDHITPCENNSKTKKSLSYLQTKETTVEQVNHTPTSRQRKPHNPVGSRRPRYQNSDTVTLRSICTNKHRSTNFENTIKIKTYESLMDEGTKQQDQQTKQQVIIGETFSRCTKLLKYICSQIKSFNHMSVSHSKSCLEPEDGMCRKVRRHS